MNLEEKAVKFALKTNKEEFENGEKSNLVRFSQIGNLIENAKKKIDQGANEIVKSEFENRMSEYCSLASNKPPFSLIFEVAKDDYSIPQREPEEGMISFLNRSQESLDRLQKEVDTVKHTIDKFEKIKGLYEKKEEFKKIVNDDIEKQRVLAVRTTMDNILEYEKAKLKLPKRYLGEIVNEVVQEKIQKEEYERFNGELSPIIDYRGKKIKAGRIQPLLNRLKERGRPISLKKEDAEASYCEDFDAFIEWLQSVGEVYNMRVDKMMDLGKYRQVHLFRKDSVL